MADSKFKLADVLKLAKLYFLDPKERFRAGLLLAGLVLTIILSIAITMTMMWWGGFFFAALTAANQAAFYSSLQVFLGLFAVHAINYGLSKYFRKALATDWSNFLYQRLLHQYITEKRYIQINQLKDLDNPSQRFALIEEVTEESLSLFSNLSWSILTFGVFAHSLWTIGGTASFSVLGLTLVLPGYAMWLSILFSVLAYGIMRYLGKALKSLLQKEQELDSNLINNMQHINKVPESIAMEQGESYFTELLQANIEQMIVNKKEQRAPEIYVEVFREFYNNLSGIFIDLMMSPLYFAGKVGLDQLMQMDMMFFQVLSALNFLMDSYEEISEYQAHVIRLMGLVEALEQPVKGDQIGINRREQAQNCLEFHEVTFSTIENQKINFQLNKGDRAVIMGASGSGKTSLFKALFGLIPIKKGSINAPMLDKIYCMPQFPTIAGKTLHQELSYPSQTLYSKEECQKVLHEVGLGEFSTEAHLEQQMTSSLSGGQKQRLGFARILLFFRLSSKKPELLLLDECTSALDDRAQGFLYDLLKQETFKDVAIVSIAHRDLKSYHNRFFQLTKESLEEEQRNDSRPARQRSYSI